MSALLSHFILILDRVSNRRKIRGGSTFSLHIYGVPTVYHCVFSIFDQYAVYTHSGPAILHGVFLQIVEYTV